MLYSMTIFCATSSPMSSAAEHLGASLCVWDGDDGSGIRQAARATGVTYRTISNEACKTTRVKAQGEPVESISAVTLHTADMAEAVAFYRALGFHLLYGGEDAPFTSFRVGSGYLNLQLDAGGSPETATWGRIVLWVDDVDAMYERAVTAGFQPDTSPADASWGERYFHIHDPSGHELSFARPLTG
jgi:catechol 2,3-dioxygenase-like lactoylglutathione lyase family enzyme